MFKVYGREGCKYCTDATNDLTFAGIDFEYIDVKLPENSESLALIKSRGLTTVPQIYDGEVHVGGYDKLRAYLKVTKQGIYNGR